MWKRSEPCWNPNKLDVSSGFKDFFSWQVSPGGQMDGVDGPVVADFAGVVFDAFVRWSQFRAKSKQNGSMMNLAWICVCFFVATNTKEWKLTTFPMVPYTILAYFIIIWLILQKNLRAQGPSRDLQRPSSIWIDRTARSRGVLPWYRRRTSRSHGWKAGGLPQGSLQISDFLELNDPLNRPTKNRILINLFFSSRDCTLLWGTMSLFLAWCHLWGFVRLGRPQGPDAETVLFLYTDQKSLNI